MDLSKFKTSDWLKVGGGVAFLIAYFLDWSSFPTYNVGGVSYGGANLSGSDFFFRGTLPWLLTVATGVMAFLLAAGIVKAGKLPWNIIFVAATALATLLVFIYIIHPTYSGVSDIGRGIGAWLGLVGAGVALAGSFIGFTESGGTLNDLKDINKIKGQFSGGSAGGDTPPPPPPPPGATPPPPPPPPPAG